MADLRFARSELAEYLCYRARFDTAGEQGVELFGTGGYGDELGAALVHLCGSREAHGDEFGGCGVETGISEVVAQGRKVGVEPSAKIFVAFCSEIPLICSRTLRGLCHLSNCPFNITFWDPLTYRPPTQPC